MKVTREQGKKKVPVVAVGGQELRAYVTEGCARALKKHSTACWKRKLMHFVRPRYERDAQRASTHAGGYERGLQTWAGTVQPRAPRLGHMPFETAMIKGRVQILSHVHRGIR